VTEPYDNPNVEKVDPDADLIGAVASGDEDAFETLVRKYERRVLNIAYRYLVNTPAAEDAAQEIFLKVWRNAKRFKGKSSFSTWLYRVVVNHCLTLKSKRERRETGPLDDSARRAGPRLDEQLEKAEKVEVIREAVGDLPGKQRMALVLSKFEGRSYKEIAEIMGVSLSSVESLIFRAKQNLKEKLSPMRKRGAI
jgi:RNA polymerase sigma-70 factor (ECF subfamily)